MEQTKRIFEIKPGNTLSLGVTKVTDGVQFAVYLPGKKDCSLKLYRIGRKKPVCIIPLLEEYKRGGAYFVTLSKKKQDKSQKPLWQILSEEYEYLYEADGEEIVDPYAHIISGRSRWGKRVEGGEQNIRAGISLQEFEWEEDKQLCTPFSEMILYQLHVRGYTKHSSSGVSCKGTFAGLQEKIPYLKELGINGVFLLPCYDFDEVSMPESEAYGQMSLNYWGYGAKNTYYLAPKASYAYDTKNPAREMKELVKNLHKAGIEVLMDIYFSPGTNICLMSDCLRHWVLNYHIDGFRINQEVMPSLMLVSDPILSGVKLLASYWEPKVLEDTSESLKVLAEYNEGFMNDARRFLKSDEGAVQPFVNRWKRNPKEHTVINFMTYVNGFTMMDLVSYDIKHNEANGERNQDGTEYNYSWNCGAEGKTRKKAVINRRMSQIRNAFLFLLCSQGTPMILAGDEFGNTQLGNNNPYCHDGAITWLDWKMGKREEEIYQYVKDMIAFRKKHPILRQVQEFAMLDTKGIGMPDMSVHSTQAWRTDYNYYNRMLGILLCGDYADDDTMYFAFNMFWEEKIFELPHLPAGKRWYVAVSTKDGVFQELPVVKVEETTKGKKKKKKEEMFDIRPTAVISPRSIVIFVGR